MGGNTSHSNSIEDCLILEDGNSSEIIREFIRIASVQCVTLLGKTILWIIKVAVIVVIVLGIFYHQTIIAELRRGDLWNRFQERTFGRWEPSKSDFVIDDASGSHDLNSRDHLIPVEDAPAEMLMNNAFENRPSETSRAAVGTGDISVESSPGLDESAGGLLRKSTPVAPPDDTSNKSDTPSPKSSILNAPENPTNGRRPANTSDKSIISSNDPPSTSRKSSLRSSATSTTAADKTSDYSHQAVLDAITKWSRHYRVELELAMAVAKHESNLEPLRTKFEPDYYRCYILGKRGCNKIKPPQTWKPMLKDESGRRMMATSWGLFQLMPATAAGVAVREGILDQIQTIPKLFEVELNARLGIAYLKQCMDSSSTFQEVGKCYNGSQSTDWWRKVNRQYNNLLQKDIHLPPK